jgi:signal transduction histidine kinase
VLERVLTLAKAGFAGHVRFIEQYDPSLPPVHGNKDRLIQVFLNLFRNACDAAPRGDRISCTLSRDSDAGTVIIDISNRGEPIAPDHLEKLFDPFFTTKANGTGLGLGIVKRIIEGHGGEVSISSSQNEGTRVRVVLPAE